MWRWRATKQLLEPWDCNLMTVRFLYIMFYQFWHFYHPVSSFVTCNWHLWVLYTFIMVHQCSQVFSVPSSLRLVSTLWSYGHESSCRSGIWIRMRPEVESVSYQDLASWYLSHAWPMQCSFGYVISIDITYITIHQPSVGWRLKLWQIP